MDNVWKATRKHESWATFNFYTFTRDFPYIVSPFICASKIYVGRT